MSRVLKGEVCFEQPMLPLYGQGTDLTDLNICGPRQENWPWVGHTGAGKSSIAKLIRRSNEFQEGRLLIDDMDIAR